MSNTNREGKSLLGLDIARLFAMGLVAIQHAITIPGGESPEILGMDIGQFGVAIFIAISGYLAAKPTKNSALKWLGLRLIRVYPAYWLTLLALFALNFIVGYKSVSPEQIFSQFVGSGYFTHSKTLVGVHTWFISLIVVCFIFAAMIKWHYLGWVISFGCCVGMSFWDRNFSGHCFTYLVAYAIGLTHSRWIAYAVAVLICTPMLVGIPEILRINVGSLAIGISLLVRRGSTPFVSRLSRGTYEFYLVHGLSFIAINRFQSNFWSVLILGSFVAIPMAIILSYIANGFIDRLLHRKKYETEPLTKASTESCR